MKKESTLGKKLASYSAMAAVILAGGKSAHAQILYTDLIPDDTVNVVDSYTLDLNNDGTTDFKFNLTKNAFSTANQVRVVGYGANSISRDSNQGTFTFYAYALALNGGAMIGGAASFYGKEILATHYSFNSFGDWPGATNKFLGLKLAVNSNVYYGWARLSVSATCDQLIVSDYAVDTVANESIAAGDKCGNYSSLVTTSIIALTSTTFCGEGSVELLTDSISAGTYQWMVDGNVITGANANSYVADATGDYNVLVTSSAGCDDSSDLAIHVEVFPLPAQPVVTQSGNTMSTASSADSYQWKFNGVAIPGATNQTYDATQSGEYTVVITDANGCTNESEPFSFIATGISNPGDGLATVYESNNQVFIQLNNEKLLGGELKIFNTLGDLVYSSSVNAKDFQIDLNHLPAAAYLMRITKNSDGVTRKIVIQ